MLGRNEAVILTKRQDIMEEIALMLEAFTDDILPAIRGRSHKADDDFLITYRIGEGECHDDELIVSWDWKLLGKKEEKVFRLSVLDTKEAFVNKIKAYLFDLTICIINL